jgi:NADH-quinone oxidoreductase subunit N
MYFRTLDLEKKVRLPWPALTVVLIGLAGTLALGLFPDLLLYPLGKIDWVSAFTDAQNTMRH